jgi:hypothetical protein
MAVLLDKAAVSRNVLPGWSWPGSTLPARGTTSGIPHFTSTADVTGVGLTLDRLSYSGSNRGNWFRIEFMLFENWNGANTIDYGSTLQVWYAGSHVKSYVGKASPTPPELSVRVWHEGYFFVTNPSSPTQALAYPGAFTFKFFGPTIFGCNPSCGGTPVIRSVQRVDGPAGTGPISTPLPPSITGSPVDTDGTPVRDITTDPVDVVSGTFYMGHTDLAVPGKGVPLTWTRAYSARGGTEAPGAASVMGQKWSHNWQASSRRSIRTARSSSACRTAPLRPGAR